jgi:hypothetical protein
MVNMNLSRAQAARFKIGSNPNNFWRSKALAGGTGLDVKALARARWVKSNMLRLIRDQGARMPRGVINAEAREKAQEAYAASLRRPNRLLGKAWGGTGLAKFFDESKVSRDAKGRFADKPDAGGGPSLRPATAPNERARYKTASIYRWGQGATEAPKSTFGDLDMRPQRPRDMPAPEWSALRARVRGLIAEQRESYTTKAQERGLIPDGTRPGALRLAQAHALALAQHDVGLHRYDFRLSPETKAEMKPLLPFITYVRRRAFADMHAEPSLGPVLERLREEHGTPWKDGRTDERYQAAAWVRTNRGRLLEEARPLLPEGANRGERLAAFKWGAKHGLHERGLMQYKGTDRISPSLRPFAEAVRQRVREEAPQPDGQVRRRFEGRQPLGDYEVNAPDPVKVADVMHEFKRGRLRSGKGGPVVKDREQALAIALSVARRPAEKAHWGTGLAKAVPNEATVPTLTTYGGAAAGIAGGSWLRRRLIQRAQTKAYGKVMARAPSSDAAIAQAGAARVKRIQGTGWRSLFQRKRRAELTRRTNLRVGAAQDFARLGIKNRAFNAATTAGARVARRFGQGRTGLALGALGAAAGGYAGWRASR